MERESKKNRKMDRFIQRKYEITAERKIQREKERERKRKKEKRR